MLFALILGTLLASERVDIHEPRQHLVLNTAELQRLCARGDHIFACTQFPEEWLEGRCVERESLWYEVVTAHLGPEMFVSLPHYAAHEWLHINDLRRRLEQYVLETELVAHASATDCQRSEDARIASFQDTMNAFRRQSNELLH